MRVYEKSLGKVSLTPEGDWKNKEYDRLCIVRYPLTGGVYLSKKAVPIDIEITNTEYWMQIGVSEDSTVKSFTVAKNKMLKLDNEPCNLIIGYFDSTNSLIATYLLNEPDNILNTSIKKLFTSYTDVEALGFYTNNWNNYIVPIKEYRDNCIINIIAIGNFTNVEIVDKDLTHLDTISIIDDVFETGGGSHSAQLKNSNSTAEGDYAVAEGYYTEATGDCSHAEGRTTTAYGDASHAEGVDTAADGNCSHAEGDGSHSSGYASHAEGGATEAYSDNSHTEGTGTFAGTNGFRWTSWDKATLTFTLKKPLTSGINDGSWLSIVNDSHYDKCCQVDGKINKGATTIKVKTAPFDDKEEGDTGYDAYTIMVVENPTNGDIDLGEASHAEGAGSKALQMFSHAEGYKTEALGQYSHAEGRENKAVYAAHAEGRETEAMAPYSHTEGQSTKAYGGKSHAEGTQTETYANNSHTEGFRDIIKDGAGAHAEGYGNVIDITEDTAITTTTATGQSIGAHAEGVSNKIAGIAAHGEGRGNKVNEEAAHVEGKNNIASGRASHAEGFTTRAGNLDAPVEQTTSTEGWFAHSEGNSTLAKGSASHAEGAATKALARASHAEGRHSIALGNYSHAEGFDTMAGSPTVDVPQPTTIDNTTEGFFAHAEGHHTLAKGNSSHAEGKNTIAEGIASHAEGADNVEGRIPLETEERLYSKAEGYASHAEGAAHAIGKYSHAEGGGNAYTKNKKTVPTAEGPYSHAEGTHTYAKGSASHAEGSLTDALGDRAHAEGQNTIASGNQAHTEGKYTKATAAHAHAEGFGSDDGSSFVEATAVAAHAEGQATKASAQGAHAEGFNSIAQGAYSHAEGRDTVAQGNQSHAEGNITSAIGPHSHASGFGSSAVSSFKITGQANSTSYLTSDGSVHNLKIGDVIEYKGVYAYIKTIVNNTGFTTNVTLSSNAINNESINIKNGVALGICAYTEGYQNNAIDNQNHAEGSGTKAIGKQSHTQGYQTRAYNNVEHAEGRWNKSNVGSTSFGNAGNTIHSVGIGSSDSNRKNAFEIMQNGDVYIDRVGGYDGTNPDTSQSLQQVLNSSGLNTIKITITGTGQEEQPIEQSVIDDLITQYNSNNCDIIIIFGNVVYRVLSISRSNGLIPMTIIVGNTITHFIVNETRKTIYIVS